MTTVATALACVFHRPRPLSCPLQTAASRCDTIGTSFPAPRLRSDVDTMTGVQILQYSVSAADNEGHDETDGPSLLCRVTEKLRTDPQALYALVCRRLCIELGNLPRKPGKLCHHCRGKSIRGSLVDVRTQFPATLEIQVVNASGVPKVYDSWEGSVQDVSEADSCSRGIAANTSLLPSAWRNRRYQSGQRGSERHLMNAIQTGTSGDVSGGCVVDRDPELAVAFRIDACLKHSDVVRAAGH
jgi:hypothetical protein